MIRRWLLDENDLNKYLKLKSNKNFLLFEQSNGFSKLLDLSFLFGIMIFIRMNFLKHYALYAVNFQQCNSEAISLILEIPACLFCGFSF